MKKNIIIIILSIITVILIYKVMCPTVVTERRSALADKYSEYSLNNSNKYVDETDIEDDENNDTNNSENAEIVKNKKHNNFQNHTKDEVIRFPKNINSDNENSLSKKKDSSLKEEITKNQNAQKDENNLSNKLKNCKPYKETLKAQYMGVDVSYEIEILGWINKKCVLDFKSKMTGVGSDFENIYGISPEDVQITSFAPNIRCEFSNIQLHWVGDAILQEDERNKGAKNNMLKNPESIMFPEFEDMSASDLKLLQILTDSKTCKIVNLEELKKIFDQLLNF